ncbi:MAG: hypothetical protein ABI268_11845 [Rhodanobacter sp.]
MKAAMRSSRGSGMNYRIRPVVALCLLLGLAACHAPSANHAVTVSDDRVLKIYDVSPAGSRELASGLQNVLGTTANISLPSEGKLLVYAPRDAQPSIEKAIATLGNATTSASPAVSLTLHVWIVDSEPGDGTDEPSLKALEPTFDKLRKTAGPMHFQLAQSAAAMASPGGETSTLMLSDGTQIQNLEFTFNRASGEGVDLSLIYNDLGTSGLKKLKTQIQAPFGQYIVLAQAPGVCPSPAVTTLTNGTGRTTTCTDKPTLRLLIVRVDRALPSA